MALLEKFQRDPNKLRNLQNIVNAVVKETNVTTISNTVNVANAVNAVNIAKEAKEAKAVNATNATNASNPSNTISVESLAASFNSDSLSLLLKDPIFIADIYRCIFNAAHDTMKDPTVSSDRDKTRCIADVKHSNAQHIRWSHKIAVKNVSFPSMQCKQPIIYSPTTLTVVGGAVYNILINDSTKSHDISDIDMVWWPNLMQYGVIIDSPAIDTMIDIFMKNIRSHFKTIKDKYNTLPDIDVYSSFKDSGVRKVNLSTKINNNKGEHVLCDITIHDGFSSQYEDGSLQHMMHDFMYCDENNTIQYKLNEEQWVRIPYIDSYMNQQLYALDNYTKTDRYYGKIPKIVTRIKAISDWYLLQNIPDDNKSKFLNLILQFIKSHIGFVSGDMYKIIKDLTTYASNKRKQFIHAKKGGSKTRKRRS